MTKHRPKPWLLAAMLPLVAGGCDGSTGPSNGQPPITGTAEVAMRAGNSFSPATVTVAPGATVRWRNEDNVEHNAVGAGGSWTSPLLSPGATFERQFNEVGVFTYTCTLHANMDGVIRVQQP